MTPKQTTPIKDLLGLTGPKWLRYFACVFLIWTTLAMSVVATNNWIHMAKFELAVMTIAYSLSAIFYFAAVRTAWKNLNKMQQINHALKVGFYAMPVAVTGGLIMKLVVMVS